MASVFHFTVVVLLQSSPENKVLQTPPLIFLFLLIVFESLGSVLLSLTLCKLSKQPTGGFKYVLLGLWHPGKLLIHSIGVFYFSVLVLFSYQQACIYVDVMSRAVEDITQPLESLKMVLTFIALSFIAPILYVPRGLVMLTFSCRIQVRILVMGRMFKVNTEPNGEKQRR